MEIYGTAVADRLDNGRGILRRRYFRQHCTLDYGSYTKDLSAISNDLSSVFILDNSPGAYRAFPGTYQGSLSPRRGMAKLCPKQHLRISSSIQTMQYQSSPGFRIRKMWHYFHCFLSWTHFDSRPMYDLFLVGIYTCTTCGDTDHTYAHALCCYCSQ